MEMKPPPAMGLIGGVLLVDSAQGAQGLRGKMGLATQQGNWNELPGGGGGRGYSVRGKI